MCWSNVILYWNISTYILLHNIWYAKCRECYHKRAEIVKMQTEREELFNTYEHKLLRQDPVGEKSF